MKKTMILGTLAAALFAVGQAHAAPISLDGAVITATYQGTADGMLGLDTGFQPGPGSNVSGLDPTNSGVEFMTADYLFAFDFSTDGNVLIYANMPPDASADYKFTFDFGNTLSAPITGFAVKDASGVTGTLGLSVGTGNNSIAIDLNQVTWNSDYTPVDALLSSDAAPANVPEPASLALVLAGVAGLRLSRRTRRS